MISQAAPDAQEQLSPQGAEGQPPASQTAGLDAASQTSQADPPPRPEWLDDDALFDAEKGVNLDALGERYKSLREMERAAAERKAQVPEKADDYGTALPDDFKLPDGEAIDDASLLWATLRESAHKHGLTPDEFKDVAGAFVKAFMADQQRKMDGVKAAQAELFKALGDNGPMRIEAVNKGLVALFGDKVGTQLAQTHFTPDIVVAHEKMLKAINDQGVTSFNGSGREAPAKNELPENWNKMTFEQRYQWSQQHKA